MARGTRGRSAGDEPETVEDIKRDTLEVLATRRKANGSPMTVSDFNSPRVRESYERFLSLLVMAGLKDRLEARERRQIKGVEAAVEFLEQCRLTSESYEGDADEPPKAKDLLSDAWHTLHGIEQSRSRRCFGRASPTTPTRFTALRSRSRWPLSAVMR
jgi:hypothetical protein